MGLQKSSDSKNFQKLYKHDTKINKTSVSSFEKLLEAVGSEGRYQKFLIVGFMLPFSVINSLGSANTTLLLTTPDHSCHVPGMQMLNVSLERWKNLTIPWVANNLGGVSRSSCSMYNFSVTHLNNSLEFLVNAEDDSEYGEYVENTLSNRSITDCQHGWDFDTSHWKETPVSYFGWICDRKYTVAKLFSLSYTGNAVGTFAFSVVSDRFGRKPTFYFVIILSVVCSVSSLVAPSVAVYSVLKFLLALSYYTMYQMPYIIIIELCGERLRNFTVVSSFIAFVFGNCLVSLCAYLTDHWKTFILVCHLPALLFLLCCRLLPESPRWLLSQSRISECEDILRRIAHTNGKHFSENSRRLLLEAQKEETERKNFRNIFVSLVLVKYLVLTSTLLSIGYILYTGMILNIHNMTGSKVVNFFILAVVEVPGNIIGSLSSHYIGRRLSSVLFNALAALSCVLAVYVVQDQWLLSLLCALTKMFSGAIVLVVYMQIGELFPTSLRATAYGITGVIGIASVIIIPPLMSMGSNVFLQYYVLCGIGIFGAILSTFLPETVGRPIPQTLPEAVRIGRKQPYFSLIHKWNAHKYLGMDQKAEDTKYVPIELEEVIYRYDIVEK